MPSSSRKAAASTSSATLPTMLALARALGRVAARLDEAEARQGQATPPSPTHTAQDQKEV